MASQLESLLERLVEGECPTEIRNWVDRDDYYISACRLSHEDIPGLIDIVSHWGDPDWEDEQDFAVDDYCQGGLISVTAWRALAELKAADAVPALIEMLRDLGDDFDDWVSEELPHVFGRIGESAVDPLMQLMSDAKSAEWARGCAASGLRRIVQRQPETRDVIVAFLTEAISRATENDVHFNSTLMHELVELHAVEAAEPIERAFAANCIDVGMLGDWQYVRRKLGVQGLGLEMPERPHNSVTQFRLNMGLGVFSDTPLWMSGEYDEDALHAYYERAWNTFSRSKEAKQAIDRFGDLGYFRSLLTFGIEHRGETVDKMTLASVQEFVVEYVPRKVSTSADNAPMIVFELLKFWEYIDRVFELPEANSIVQWLRSPGLEDDLKFEMSDPANFGMAKQMVMAGVESGYDMSSEAGVASFMAARNESLDSPQLPAISSSRSQAKVGRNDLCPCGSGKKFKKCCIRK